MTQQPNGLYPHTAITTWSGYVYQGRVALYHCLQLIHQGNTDFDLQLDSSDDFAIYQNNSLISAHQVKAKVSKYRSGYIDALEKSACIEFDRISGIKRYFHVSVDLDNSDNYIAKNNEEVRFYEYDNKKYCGLGEIEGRTKALLIKIFDSYKIVHEDQLINYYYCLLSDQISTKAMEIHRLVQEDKTKANLAAFQDRISALSILEQIKNNNPYDNQEYYALDLKSRLYSYLEERLDRALPQMDDKSYVRAKRLFSHFRAIESSQLIRLCQLMKPSEAFQAIQKADIRRYSELIENLKSEPILNQFPHYLDDENQFYLPTALDLPLHDDQDPCTADLLSQMETNNGLLELLFEYNNLIAARSTNSFTIDTKYTQHRDLTDQSVRERLNSNITNSLNIRILTQRDAENLIVN